jgi:hypothetical protein
MIVAKQRLVTSIIAYRTDLRFYTGQSLPCILFADQPIPFDESILRTQL